MIYLITVNVKQAFSLIVPQQPKNDMIKIRIPIEIKNSGA